MNCVVPSILIAILETNGHLSSIKSKKNKKKKKRVTSLYFSLSFCFSSLHLPRSIFKPILIRATNRSMDFNLENPLANSHDFHFDTIPSDLFLIESDHMPSNNYLNTLKEMDFDGSFRREAISSVLRVGVQNVKHNPLLCTTNFICIYIFLDRFFNILCLVVLFSGFLQLRSILVLSCC